MHLLHYHTKDQSNTFRVWRVIILLMCVKCFDPARVIIIEHLKLCQPKEQGMNYSMGSGIIRYIRVSKTFSKLRTFRSSVRFEVPCVSKFRAFRSSVCFEVPCASKFLALRSSVRFEVPCGHHSIRFC